MFTLLALVLLLLLGQTLCLRLARRSDSRLMRPAEDLEPEDVDRGLDLIEPCDLRDPTAEPRG